MQSPSCPVVSAADLVERLRLAICERRLHDAETFVDSLREHAPSIADTPVISTALALARNDPLTALQALAGRDDVPELRAVCLMLLGDPAWEGLAESLSENSGDSRIRDAMLFMLGRADSATR